MNKDKLFVTVPSLPPLQEYMDILQKVWDTKILTNNGELLLKLEKDISKLFRVKECITVTNGTVALQLAIRALELKGEIITTPFTWIATASAIRYEGCTPVFIDIDPETFNINPDLIESAITDKTVAIMPVHVFSNPCDIDKIEAIAKKHNLKVIYDAAHAFGVDYKGESIMNYGDISCTSFHATKLFNTGEGGACFSQDKKLIAKLKQLRFFGHNEEKEIISDGCNGKMTELHAAMGLANLKYYKQVLQRRKKIFNLYYQGLSSLNGIKFQKLTSDTYNHSYMPVVFESEEITLKIEQELNKNDIYPRRYFYPSLDTLDYLGKPNNCPISQDIASRILCLPSHNWISNDEIKVVINIISKYNVVQIMNEYHVINTRMKHHVDGTVKSIIELSHDLSNIVIVFLVDNISEFEYENYSNINKIYLTNSEYKKFYIKKIWKNKIISHFINSPIKNLNLFLLLSIVFRTRNLYIILGNGVNLRRSLKGKIKKLLFGLFFRTIHVATLSFDDQKNINAICNCNRAYYLSYKSTFIEYQIDHKKINVLVCHHGYPANNHVKVFNKIIDYWNDKNYNFYCPVSYGNEKYISSIKKYVFSKKIKNIFFIDNLMSKENYCKFLSSMNLYITGADIQTSLFVIFSFLKMGKPIFVGDNLYNYLKDNGFVSYNINSITAINIEKYLNNEYKNNAELYEEKYSDMNLKKQWNRFIKNT